MKRRIILTADGSKTIHLEDWNEQYHSKHGAVQEAYHVFVEMGLRCFRNTKLSILEAGFGTGLNALITLVEASKLNLNIEYTALEAYPVSKVEITALDYVGQLGMENYRNAFQKMHDTAWEKRVAIASNFFLTKYQTQFQSMNSIDLFNLVYYDAFGPRVQPELWTEDIFKNMYRALRPKGILVTYSAKGTVRRALQSVGFTVERLPGPPGKREMLRATKT